MECPKCSGTLQPEIHEGVQIDRCEACKGIWFDMGEREELAKVPGSESIDREATRRVALDNKARVLCPRDKQQMTRMVHPAKPTVWFESCPNCHGVFLDAGEFRALKEDPSFWERLFRPKRHRPLT